MLDEEGDADTVDGTAVDVLVDLRSLVGKVDVVPGIFIIYRKRKNPTVFYLSTPCLMMK